MSYAGQLTQILSCHVYRECDKIKSFIELLEKTLGPV